jgi:hypothetical protein
VGDDDDNDDDDDDDGDDDDDDDDNDDGLVAAVITPLRAKSPSEYPKLWLSMCSERKPTGTNIVTHTKTQDRQT